MQRDLHRSWGRRIRQRRELLGMTQVDLAEKCQLTQATISRIEAGAFGPRDHTKWLLAGALCVTVEELFPYPAVVPPVPGRNVAA